MLTLIIIGWLACGVFGAWRYADQQGAITLWDAVCLFIGGIFSGLTGLLLNPPWRLRINLNPIIWRRKPDDQPREGE